MALKQILLQAALWLSLVGGSGATSDVRDGKRPNVLFILTDDQDVHMNSLEHMPYLQKHLVQQGTTFDRHYCTVALCCPSRVNLWTGQMPHNTNVTDVRIPYGGYPKFIANGYNDKHLALWMQRSGYNTYYTGKMMNAQTTDNYNKPPLSGYTGSEFLLDPYTYQYYNVTSTYNNQPPRNVLGKYSPDLTANSTYAFLKEALASDKPWFLTTAPIAPHADGSLSSVPVRFGPPKVDPRHQGLFKDYKIPRTANFNPSKPKGASWIARLPRLNDTVLEQNDDYQRNRLRALQSVDEMIDALIKKLEKAGVLDDTYIMFTADNGYHISQYRLHPGKECGFETDINVPLIVRGPGVPKGKKDSTPSSHTDFVPTIMGLAGNPYDKLNLDGRPIQLKPTAHGKHQQRTEHVAIEFWGSPVPEDSYFLNEISVSPEAFANNTYKGVRIEAERYGFYYSVWCTNEKELYDMKKDPYQVDNLLASTVHYETDERQKAHVAEPVILGRPLHQLVSRLDALMMVLKSCKQSSCTDPWGALHPKGNVHSLEAALKPAFDKFYKEQPKVSFSRCEQGYIKSSEGPQRYDVLGEMEYRDLLRSAVEAF